MGTIVVGPRATGRLRRMWRFKVPYAARFRSRPKHNKLVPIKTLEAGSGTTVSTPSSRLDNQGLAAPDPSGAVRVEVVVMEFVEMEFVDEKNAGRPVSVPGLFATTNWLKVPSVFGAAPACSAVSPAKDGIAKKPAPVTGRMGRNSGPAIWKWVLMREASVLPE